MYFFGHFVPKTIQHHRSARTQRTCRENNSGAITTNELAFSKAIKCDDHAETSHDHRKPTRNLQTGHPPIKVYTPADTADNKFAHRSQALPIHTEQIP